MSQLSLNKFGDNLPVTSIVSVSQAAVGFGVGLLVADTLGRTIRRRTAIAVIAAGAAALTPVAIGIFKNLQNRPTSSRRMRKKLEGIRRDVGVPDSPGVF